MTGSTQDKFLRRQYGVSKRTYSKPIPIPTTIPLTAANGRMAEQDGRGAQQHESR
jgi:hypothetical protein